MHTFKHKNTYMQSKTNIKSNMHALMHANIQGDCIIFANECYVAFALSF